MIRDEGRFLKAKAQVLQQLGDIEDVVEDAEALVNALLDHGRTPAGTAEPGLDWPLVNECGQGFLLRRGQIWCAAWRLFVPRPLELIAAEGADPGRAGLLVYA